jgi:hypothetical protein
MFKIYEIDVSLSNNSIALIFLNFRDQYVYLKLHEPITLSD